ASFNDFCQFVSEQADLATDPIYSEEGISKPMNAVEKYHKQNERKPKRGRDAGDVPVAMGIIPVWLYHKDNPSNKICVYALLDNARGGTFIKEDSLRRLGVKGSETKLLLTTMHGTQEVDTKAVDGLMASHC
ncbi:unnamed protein product, partial [Porites lobata]